MVGNVMAIVVGALLGLVPVTMENLEKLSNRWISTRKMGRGGESMNLIADRWVAARPRFAGVIFLIFSLVEIACVLRAMR